MRKLLRPVFTATVLLLWIIVVLVALELYGRWRHQDIILHAQERVLSKICMGMEADKEAVKQTVPDYDAFMENKDDSMLKKLKVLRREELPSFSKEYGCGLLLCISNGKIVDIVNPDTADLSIIEWLKEIRPGDRIDSILYGENGRDALSRMKEANRNSNPISRDYMISTGNAGLTTFNLSFVPPRDYDNPFIVAVRLSFWKTTFFSFRPNASQHTDCDIRINSMGWRDDEIAIPKPSGVVRIVCTGGSNTAGGPNNALTYPNILQDLLRKKYGNDRIETVNCGVYGLSTAGEMIHFNDYMKLEPDIIVQYNVYNDIPVMCSQLVNTPSLQKRDSWVRMLPKYVSDAGAIMPLQCESRWCVLRSLFHRSAFLHLYANQWLQPGDDTLRSGFQDYTVRNMLKWLVPASKAGVKIAVCSFPYPDLKGEPIIEKDYFENAIMRTRIGYALNFDSFCHFIDVYNKLLKVTAQDYKYEYIPLAESLHGGLELYKDLDAMRVDGLRKEAEIVAENIAPLVESSLSK